MFALPAESVAPQADTRGRYLNAEAVAVGDAVAARLAGFLAELGTQGFDAGVSCMCVGFPRVWVALPTLCTIYSGCNRSHSDPQA
jgi:hypothetical protein